MINLEILSYLVLVLMVDMDSFFFQIEILKENPGKKWEKSKKIITFVLIKIKGMGIDGLMGI